MMENSLVRECSGTVLLFNSHTHIFVGLEFELKGFALAKQVFYYYLSHTFSPLCSGYFGDGGLTNNLPVLASNCNSPDLNLPSS
jgi:hypothetical protein